jgi:antitoxin component of MazEF toxin-antitoxin module
MARKNVIVISAVVIAALFACAAMCAEKQKGKIELPKLVKSAIKALYPAGEIKETKKEKECLKLYNVKVDANGVEVEVSVDADGIIAEVETKEKVEDLPAAVAKTVTAQGGEVIEAEKKVIHAQLKLVELAAPVTKYEVKIKKDGKVTELRIADNGKILKEQTKKEKKECSKEKQEKKESDKDKKDKVDDNKDKD